jgi:glycosyltransferase involved in cell wall biosynthesis
MPGADSDTDAAGASRRPFFSIIVPLWNRADCIGRCLASVAAQDLGDYELIVVDDGSTDDSVRIVEQAGLPKRLLRHEKNRGACAARRTGTRAANGEWLLYLDSDWALLGGALRRLHRDALDAPDDVGVVGASCRMDDGPVIPFQPPPEGPFGLVPYLAWLNPPVLPDYLYAIRREVFRDVSWPSGHQREALFHLRIAGKWRTQISRQVLAEVHTDAPDRVSVLLHGLATRVRTEDQLAERQEILREYGRAIRRHAPRWYAELLRGIGAMHLAMGRRAAGTGFVLRHLLRRPLSVRGWSALVLGLVGPAAVAWGKARWQASRWSKRRRAGARRRGG